jgi:hypothetical protein
VRSRADAIVLVLDVSELVDLDAGTIDALARLQLGARRLGFSLRLRHACDDLQGLLELTGLAEALPLDSDGKVEQREELRLEEDVDGRDAPG